MEPKATSTPYETRKIRGRGPTQSQLKRDAGSPIPLEQKSSDFQYTSKIPDDNGDYDSLSEDENLCEDRSDNELKVSAGSEEISDQSSCYKILWLFVIPIAIIFYGKIIHEEDDTTPESYKSLATIKQDFPGQTEDFWLSVNVSINEIQRSERPKSIVFLFEKQSQNSLRILLREISQYALCELKTCKAKEIILKPEDLTKPEILQDYGRIIENYRENLSENGVMIVEHIEQIPGVVAQAFHSLCDEDNPVVGRALFLFTMQVDRIPKANRDMIGYVERSLKAKWSDVKSDNFQPLITRMTSFVLPVR